MNLKETRVEWECLGKVDPYWAVLTDPDKVGGRWNKSEFFKTGEEEIQQVFNELSRRNIKIKFYNALDFGCGVGRLTFTLAKYFKIVSGVDISSSMINEANKLNILPKKCKYYLNKRKDLSLFQDNSFDFIYSSIVLQHNEPNISIGYLKEFSRVLNSKGILVFQLPSERISLITKFYNFFIPRQILNLIRRFTRPHGLIIEMHPIPKAKVVKALNNFGFEVIAVLKDRMAGSNYVSFKYFCRKK